MHIKNWQRLLIVVGLGIAVLTLAVGCGGGDDEEDEGGSAPTSAATTSSGQGSDGKAQTVKVTLKDNLFEPKEISVDEGAVTFELKNEGAAIHNMHILSKTAEGKDYMSKTTIEGGASDKFTATFTKSGSIKFQCDFHLPDMVGTINVK